MLPAEKELIATNGRLVVLTSHRIRLDSRASGEDRLVSITLDAVASCGVVSRSMPMLVVRGVLAALAGAAMLNTSQAIGGLLLIVAVIFIGA